MIKIYAYICLLSALSVVEMEPLNINGRVGESVTFKCSDWDVWTGERFNVKYFCDSPCTDDKHIIVKAASGKTTNKNRIELTNRAKGLSVTFTNLQKSDSKTYYCGVERPGFDLYVKVNLQVTDAVSSSPKTTPTTVISSSTMSSSSSDIITEMSTSYTTLNTTTPSASATQRAGYVPYLIAGLIFIIKIVMVGLILTRKMMKKQQTLSVVEMKILNINGRVGESVKFLCSDWDVWIGVKSNDKYFCDSPCSEDKHIIIKAAFGKTTNKNRIKLTNTGKGLSVTFTNLQKSDSKTYYCGVKRTGLPDSYIKVNLQVTDAVSSRPKTTPKTVPVVSPLSFVVTSSSSMSSHSSDIITNVSTSYTTLNTMTHTASATQGAGSVPYLVIGVVVVITILMVFLKIMSKMMKTKRKVVSSADTPQEDARGDVEYEEIRPEDQVDSDCLYANYSHHQDTELAAESGNSYSNDVSLKSASRFEANSRGACAESRVIYSVAQLPEEQIEPTVQSEPNQSESYENDLLYSMAELPQAT